MRLRTAFVVSACVSFATHGFAQSAASDKELARRRFERGLELARDGKLEQASGEFEAAYQASPHYSVLYNLGQTYSALGRPVEALRALERYLEEAGTQISPERRAEVEASIATHRARIGFIVVDLSPAGAELEIDGRVVGKSPFRQKLALAAGTHGVVARHDGAAAATRSIRVEAGADSTLTIRLAPRAPLGATPAAAQLAVECAVPDVEVRVDGRALARTPLALPLLVPAGTRRVEFTRAGYARAALRLDVPAGALQRVPCSLQPLANHPAVSSRLALRTGAPDPALRVDGRLHDGRALPAGPHLVEVTSPGHRPWRGTVVLQQNEQKTLDLRLRPTPEYAAELERERSRQLWAIGLGTGGLVLAGAALAAFAVNTGRHDALEDDRTRIQRRIASGQVDQATLDENARIASRAADIRSVDDLALGMAIGAGVAFTASIVLWVSGTPQSTRAARFDGVTGRW